jgi:hypothetical protein
MQPKCDYDNEITRLAFSELAEKDDVFTFCKKVDSMRSYNKGVSSMVT